MAQRILVISDIHMAAEGCGFFSANHELKKFIQHARDLPGELDLVILGDALDYLQIKPYLSFTATEAEKKTGSIIDHNKDVFSALRDYVAQAGKRLLWAIGNHDLELLFPNVRQMLENEILSNGADSSSRKLIWHLDDRPIDYRAWNQSLIRLVHGNQGDSWNAVNYDAARAAVDAGTPDRRVYPLGSVLVAEVLNPLHSQGFRHVHLLKPETTVALPLSLALWPDDTWALIRAAFPLFARKRYADSKTWLSQAFGITSKKTYGSSGEPERDAEAFGLLFDALLKQTVLSSGVPFDSGLASDLGSWLTRQDSRQELEHYLGNSGQSQTATYGGPSWVKRSLTALLQGAARSANGTANPWIIDQEDDLAGTVRDSFSTSGAVVLICGHTHLARAVSYRGGYYLNTGTWADLMKIPRAITGQEFRDYARGLREYLGDLATSPYELRPFRRLTYVDIELGEAGGRPYTVSLREWPAEFPKILHQYP